MSLRAPAWRRYLRFRGPNVRGDVDDEIAFHIETTAAAYVAAGDSPAHARQRAMEEFGNVRVARAQCYSIGDRRRRRRERGELFAALGQDIRYALRVLRESPGFTASVVGMIAVAMAANAAAFSVIDRLILRPPDYMRAPSEVHRAYELTRVLQNRSSFGPKMSYLRYADLVARTHAFSEIVAIHDRQSVIRVGRSADVARVAYVTANFWNLFDATPAIGRFASARDEAGGARPMIAVLSYDFWRAHFRGDSDAVGSSVAIGDDLYRIVGVAPRRFAGASVSPPALFIPIVSGPKLAASRVSSLIESYNTTWLDVIVRRRAGWTVERATGDLDAALRWSLERQRSMNAAGVSALDPAEVRGLLGPIKAERGPLHTTESRVALWLAALAAIVLLVAALNVANLMLARLLRRRREIAVRLALGVSATRLVRLLLTEATMVVTAGAAVSLALVGWFADPLRQRMLPNTHLPAIVVDGRIIAFTVASALLTSLVIALAPALRALRWNVVAAIGGGDASQGRRRSRLQSTLIVVQTAFSLGLLVSAGLFVRSMRNIRALPLGYDPRHVLVVNALDGATAIPGVPPALTQTLVSHAAAIPGIEATALSTSLPFSKHVSRAFGARKASPDSLSGFFSFNIVSPGYFHTVGTRLIAGRDFNAGDDGSTPVAIVSAPMARRVWPGRDAIGQCLTSTSTGEACIRVVGVADGVREWSYENDEMIGYYVPLVQGSEFSRRTILLRTTGDASSLAERARRILEADAPEGTRLVVTPMQDALDIAAQSWRTGATTLSFLAAIALVLAAIGIYGVVAYDLTEWQRDVGIRVALGASPVSLLRAGVVRVLSTALAGVGAGALLSLAVGPAIETLLFQVSSRDPATLVGACVVVLVAFGTASAVPVIRAARADPALILRSG